MASTPADSGDSTVRLRVNATDPTESQQLRNSFQTQILDRWDDVEQQVEDWFTGTGELNYDRLRLRFRTWFESTAFNVVLEQANDADVNNGRHWTASYIRDAYQQGLKLAKRDLQTFEYTQRTISQATKYFADAHQQPLTRSYESAYIGLSDQIHRMVDEVSKRLREGIQERESREWFVENVNDRIEKVGKNQGKAHGNTVVVETVNDALLNAFQLAGVEQVGVAPESSPGSANLTNYVDIRTHADGDPETFAEAVGLGDDDGIPDPDDPRDPDEVQFVTAGDAKVCEQCMALEGTVVDIAKARGTEGKLAGAGPGKILPVHPNCRCRWLPVAPS